MKLIGFQHFHSSLLCGNAWIVAVVEIPTGITTIAWKTLRVSHNPLEKLKRSFSTLPQSLFFIRKKLFENLHKILDTTVMPTKTWSKSRRFTKD